MIAPATSIPTGSEKEICDFLEKEANWYEKAAADNQRYYNAFKTAEMVIAALIPVTSVIFLAIEAQGPTSKIVSAVLGLLVVILEGILQQYAFHERWVNYTVASESLKLEKLSFEGSVAPYNGTDRVSALAASIRNLLSKDLEAYLKVVNTPKPTKNH